MNADLKRRWVEALRSGKYPQAKRRLRTDRGYCCLAVLCEVADGFRGWDDPFQFFHADGTEGQCYLPVFDGGDVCGSRSLLPRHLQTEVTVDQQRTLADMNDHEDKTFAEIADFIEANL